MPIIAAVYLFCYFSKNHIYSCLILSFLAKIFLDIQWGTTNVNGYWVYPIAMSIYFVVGAGYLSSDKNVTRMIEFYDTSNYRTFPASNGQELGSTTIWCIGKK